MRSLAALALLSSVAFANNIESLTISRPEGARHYLLATPQPTHTGRMPLVILLHGHTDSAKQLLGQGMGAAPLSAWLGIADREGLLLIAPDGAPGDDGK